MKTLITAFMLFVSLSVIAQDPMYEKTNGKKKRPSVAALDEKYGFRNVTLEADISSFNDLVPFEVEESDGMKLFTRSNDELNIGEYDIEPIVYAFYKDKLLSILIMTKGYSNSRGVLEVLRTQYGNGYQENRYIDKYTWSGKRAALVYSENSITNDATITLLSRSLLMQSKKDEKESAAKAAQSDF